MPHTLARGSSWLWVKDISGEAQGGLSAQFLLPGHSQKEHWIFCLEDSSWQSWWWPSAGWWEWPNALWWLHWCQVPELEGAAGLLAHAQRQEEQACSLSRAFLMALPFTSPCPFPGRRLSAPSSQAWVNPFSLGMGSSGCRRTPGTAVSDCVSPSRLLQSKSKRLA